MLTITLLAAALALLLVEAGFERVEDMPFAFVNRDELDEVKAPDEDEVHEEEVDELDMIEIKYGFDSLPLFVSFGFVLYLWTFSVNHKTST